MDTSDPLIEFDGVGQCNHCRLYHDTVFRIPRFRPDADRVLAAMVEETRALSAGGKYDCVIGVSGGVDSTYLAYYVKRVLDLNPLAVHMDNGWNSELAVSNIEQMISELKIDLHTEVLDWREFSELQRAFLKASTPDSEIPTDHAISATLYKVAVEKGIPTIYFGNNLVTEAILPRMWSYGHQDWIYIRALNRLFGTTRLRRYPHTSMWRYFYLFKLRKLRVLRLFDYIPFDRAEVEALIMRELGWRPYGAKHFESVYTKFFQGYLLPQKFGFDKRRAHMSSLICAGQMTRGQALQALQAPALDPDEVSPMLDYVAKKLRFAPGELEGIFRAPPKTYKDYPNSLNSRFVRSAKRLYKILGGGILRDGLRQ
jgi:N-acetyl sugar amidotransferase